MATSRRYGTGTKMLNEFIQYLIDQIGQPYLWGGQHTKLTPENYEAVIHKREGGRGKYADGQTYADASIAYCKKLFDRGAEVLYAYDCSGLGMYWLADLKHLYSDTTADGMMHKCESISLTEPPKKGWWVFRVSNGRATHIGYMVDDEHVVQAEGRRFGVTYKNFRAKDWTQWGIPKCFRDEILNPEPEPQPEPPEPPVTKQFVEVIGKSVRVRAKDSILGKTLFIAHRGSRYELIDIAPSGWYHIMTVYPDAYITNKPKYTKVVEL